MSNRFLKNRFLSIIDKYLKGKSTAEQEELVDYFYDSIRDADVSESKLTAIEKEIKAKIHQRIESTDTRKSNRSSRRFIYLKIAASITIIATVAILIYNNYNAVPEGKKPYYVKNVQDKNVPIVILNDGKSYQLQDSISGKLSYKMIGDEKVFIIEEDPIGTLSEKLSQIKNPTNKIFTFLLQDGTKAWLNPNSTLEILPEENNKRMVRIEGTVLFDVQKIKEDKNYKPFVVKTALQTIEVLGTRFVVNSSSKSNEDVLLLEGKIKLTHNNYHTEVILKPDQKASLKSNEANILVTKSSDSYKVEAWHKGLFHFENEKMADVMAEIAQWYGQNIIVDRSIENIPITGMISRYKNINEVLELIELTNNVKYQKSAGKIYIR